MRQRLLLVVAACTTLVAAGCSFDEPRPPSPGENKMSAVPTVLILDASGSMTENDAPGPRIDAARGAAHQLINALPDDVPLALQTYGTSTGSADSDKALGCQDVTVLLPLGPLDRTEMASAIDGIAPSGYTPITRALQIAADQLPADDSPQAIVLVSDGEDTCDVPPCPVAAQLSQERPGLTISTVGFRVDGEAVEQLRCIAESTGGLFVQAANADQLASRLLATQNIDEANQSLSSSGMFGLSLGDTITSIRAKFPDFPDVDSSGAAMVAWGDCDFDFVDGILDGIRPHDGGRTIDGLTVGTPISKAVELYGHPLSSTLNADLTTVIVDAGANTDAAYRIDVDGYSESDNTFSGIIDTIALCRCKPQAQPTATVDAAAFWYSSRATSTGYFFESPSRKWRCAIVERLYAEPGAGCESTTGREIPVPGAPLVPANDVADNLVHPSSIIMSANEGPRFVKLGQPYLWRGEGLTPVLEYDSNLTALGFTCNIQQNGISCRHDATGKGFTISTEGYRFEYTPIPAVPASTLPESGEVVLGGPTDQYSVGYGTPRPDAISTNSLCGNTVNDVSWESWGGPTAHGSGTLCQSSGSISRGEAPQHASLTASDIGQCQGKLAYRKLQFDSHEPMSIC